MACSDSLKGLMWSIGSLEMLPCAIEVPFDLTGYRAKAMRGAQFRQAGKALGLAHHSRRQLIGFVDDLLHHLGGQRPTTSHLLHHGLDLRLLKTPERQRGHVVHTGPRRLKPWPEREDSQDRQATKAIYHKVEQFE